MGGFSRGEKDVGQQYQNLNFSHPSIRTLRGSLSYEGKIPKQAEAKVTCKISRAE
jgi:hypothetical protein